MPKALSDPKSNGRNTVALDSHALGTLQYIRASIDAAGLLAVPGSAGIAMGAVGVLAALLVALKVVAEHAISGKALLEFLGPNDQSPNRKTRLVKFVRARGIEKIA